MIIMENYERSPFGRRLFEAREAAGFTQEEAAKAVGMKSQSTLSEAEIAGKRSSYTFQLARLYNVNPDWLADGMGYKEPGLLFSRIDNNLPSLVNTNVTMIGLKTISTRSVPLISYVEAGKWGNNVNKFALDVAQEHIETTLKITGLTFALKVEGDSMEPMFPSGATIIVEPELTPQSGDYVVVRQSGSNVTFKELVIDGNQKYLKPLNPRYPVMIMDKDAAVIGVVVEMLMKVLRNTRGGSVKD